MMQAAGGRSRRGNRAGKKKKNGGPEGNSAVERDLDPERLPQVQDQLAVGMRLRFVATELFTGTVTVDPSKLLDAWFLAGTATNAYQLFDFVRVKKVTIRTMGAAQPYVSGVNNPRPPVATCGVEFIGLSAGSLAGGKQKEDTAIGYGVPAMVSLKPDPKSQAAQFQPSSGNTIFNIRAVDSNGQAVPGTIVDVDVVYRNSGDVNPAAVANARAGLTPGDLYFGGLDGNPLNTTGMRSTFIRRA